MIIEFLPYASETGPGQLGIVMDYISDCNLGTTDFVLYYQANCGKWGKCTYNISGNVDCDMGFDPVPQGTQSVDVWGWKSCGTTCCKKIYKVCKDGSNNNNIHFMDIQKQKLTPCTDQALFTPCDDGC